MIRFREALSVLWFNLGIRWQERRLRRLYRDMFVDPRV